MSGFKMDDYVDVAQRIQDFYERFPEGSLRTGTQPYIVEANGKQFVVYHAQAWRTPDDPCPSDGWAWEPVPGPTQFTRDSELMNAETAAWGRAIVALGFSTKKIASAQEVKARTEPRIVASDEERQPLIELLSELAEVDSSKDWLVVANTSAKRKFGQDLERLTRGEVDALVKDIQSFLDEKKVAA